MDKIFTASDRAQELGYSDYLGILEGALKHEINREVSDEFPVSARVDFGRWIADCGGTCKGSSYVDPANPVFYCAQCDNSDTAGKLRRVVFPENIAEIEAELLKREAIYPKGMFGTQAAASASGLPRSWNGETIEELQQQKAEFDGVSKDELMGEYLRTLARLQELQAQIGESENGL